MFNTDIRTYAQNHGVKLYEIATKLGMQDSNFSRSLRKELSNDKKNEIFLIIDSIFEEHKAR